MIENRLSDGLTLYERHAPRTLRDFLLALLKVLSEGRPDFMRTLAELDDGRFQKTRQQRRFVCEDHSLVYIGSPHLTASVARLACEAAGLPCASVSKLRL